MDLVQVCYDGYWSKILQGYHPHPCIYDVKVKVTGLEFLCCSFTLKVLGPRYFQTWSYISFMLGMMIDTGPKFYRVTPLYPVHDLTVNVMDLEFLCKNASERKSAIQASCPVRRQLIMFT